MTKLECNVTNCLHNADHCCCKQSIMVDGHDAKEKEQTCCGSFDENKGCLFKNVFKTPGMGQAGRNRRSAPPFRCPEK